MNVAVTGLNNVDNPGPGVPVARALRDAPEFSGRILGLLYDALEPGAYLPSVADASYVIPYPSAGLEHLFDRLRVIHEKENIDVIIPTLDAELNGFIRLAPRLRALGIRTFLPGREQLGLRAKDKLAEFCRSNNIAAPRNMLASSVQDLYAIQSSFDYPVAVKGIFYDATIANNFEEAQAAFHRLRIRWGLPIVIQEFVRGDEYNVCALGNNGATVGAVAMKKLYITDKGKGWSGITIREPSLIALTESVVTALRWNGGLELEFVRDRDTNAFILLEINPRFPAWVYLTAAAGQNLPLAALKLALGQPVPAFGGYDVGKMFIRYSWDLITDIKRFEEITVTGELHNA
jgi:carbamoyl-phosphate synthase large subunit